MMVNAMLALTLLLLIIGDIHAYSTALFARRLTTRILNTHSTVPTVISSSSIDITSNRISASSSSFSKPLMDEDDEEDEETKPTISNMAPDISPNKEGVSFPTALNGSDVRVGILMSRWNADIVQGLSKGVNESLTAAGVLPSNVFTTYVPGAFELPLTAKFLAASKRVDVIICLGCLIKGETMHFEVIAEATANGIMQVGLETYVPIIFGVLTVYNKEQAIVRSTGDTNEGISWGKSAVEMALARMSALGMGQPKSSQGATSAAFVNFNSSQQIMPKVAVPSNSSKKFGF